MKIIIIGAGPAGASVAYFLKKKGITDITVFEKENVGGLAYTRFYEGIPYEFGPQILYSAHSDLVKIFEEFITLTLPPNELKKYKPLVSIDGTSNPASLHDFPITFNNIIKHPERDKILEEIYNVNLDAPDFSNFERYVVSRIGKTLYDTYIKNYNIKQWKIHPREMDAEWAKFRPFKIQNNTVGMFNCEWCGHPGNHNPIWDGMLKGVKLIKGKVNISNDFNVVEVNGAKLDADLIISTLPLSDELEFIGSCLVYVSIKSERNIMLTYATSFPNNYDFVRIMEYKQQYHVDSEYSLLDFQFPWKDSYNIDNYINQVKHYVKHILNKEITDIWVENKKNLYPISNNRNLDLVQQKFKEISKTNIMPIGRAGVYAYVSKDSCLNMARILADNIEEIVNGNSLVKEDCFMQMRNRLS